MNDVNVHLIAFPTGKAKEVVVPCEDGTYSVFIDKNIASNQQLLAYNHAMKHIKNFDFEKEDVQQIESVAHK